MKLKTTFADTALFNKETTLLNDPDNSILKAESLSSVLREGTQVTLVIEASFVWCFNKQIGISWILRQVKLSQELVEEEEAPAETGASWSLV